jgi:hypothetical protein
MAAAGSLYRNAVVTAGVVALVFLGIQHEREQRAMNAKLAGDVASLRTALADLPAPSAPAAPNVTVQAIDPASLDAVAARAAHAAAAEEATEARAAAEKNAPTGEQLGVRDGARRIVEASIARGQLRVDDVSAMRRALADDAEGEREISRQIAVAINLGKLTPEDPHEIYP